MKLNSNAAECLSIDITFIQGFMGLGPTCSKFDMGKTHSERGELTSFFSFQEEKQSHKNDIAGR